MTETSIWSLGDMSGPPGPPGAAATIQVGNVTTGAAGTNVVIVNTGTNTAAVFDFTIPKGDPGVGVQGPIGPPGPSIQGPIGPDGPQGLPGSTIYPGVGIPSNAIGINGDYYLDQASAILYGPKAANVWPGSGLDLRGGASGVNYGTRTITNNATTLAKTAAADPTLVSNADYTQVTGIFGSLPDGIVRGITQQTNSITVGRTGAYEIMLWASVSTANNNVNVAFKFAVNGVISLVRRPIVRLDVANSIGTVCANGLVQLNSGDVITLWIASTVTTAVRIYDAVFSLKEQR